MLTCYGELDFDWLFFIRPESDHCLPFSLTAVVETWLRWHWRVNILTQNLLILYVLLMLMLRDVLTTVWSRFWRWILMFPKRSYFGERLYLPVRCVFGHVLFFWPSSGLERFRLNFPSSPILSIFPMQCHILVKSFFLLFFPLSSIFEGKTFATCWLLLNCCN